MSFRSILLLLTLAFITALHAEKVEMITRSFKVLPAFLPKADLDSQSSSDPFAPRPVENKTLKQSLEDAGITFPEGSSVSRGSLGEIVCRNTEQNLERLKKHIDSLNAANAAAQLVEKPQLHTRSFKVPPDFLSSYIPSSDSPAAPADPFAAPATTPTVDAPPPKRHNSAKQLLEAQGVTFPEGTSASFNPVTSLLTVTNTQPNLDLVEAYAESLKRQAPANVAFTLTVIEGPGELIRAANAAASRSADAAPALATLLDHAKKPGSNVRIVGDAFLETKSGTRATVEAVREHNHATEFKLDAKSRASVAKETSQIGLHLEIEPTVAPDSSTIEVTVALTLNAAPPSQRQVSVNDPLTGHAADFSVTDIAGTRITTGVSIIAGSTKLLGISKPVGTPQENADVLCAVFLTATLRRAEALPLPQPKVPVPAIVPPGMIFATLPAPDGLFDEFLNATPPVTLQAWLAQAGTTFPSGSLIEHHDGVLRLINTPGNVAFIMWEVEQRLRVSPSTVAFTLHTLEAPAHFLRDLARQTLASADDSAMFAAVEAAVARGEAKFIHSIFLETKSGNRATHHATREHRYLDTFATNRQGRPDLGFKTRLVGSLLEVEPTIGADDRTVELTFTHELHPAAPVLRRDQFRDPASQQPFEMPITDFHSTKTSTSISITNGEAKLISLNKPNEHRESDVLWATFINCDVVSQVAKSRKPSSEETHKPKPFVDPKAWNTRRFHIPPDFLHAEDSRKLTANEKQENVASKPTAKMILEAQEIPFPEGAIASFNPATAMLFVKNTNENLALVESYVKTLTSFGPKLSTFTSHVFQGPGQVLRRITAQAASKSDHRAELDELLAAVKAGTVLHLNTARIETKSGTRATAEQVTQHQAITEVSVNDKGEPFFTQEMRRVGLRVEVEPTVFSDGVTVDLTLAPEFHTAAPFEHREHIIDTQGRRLEFPLTDYHAAKVNTAITLPDGTARLLSLYKPTGRPEFEKEDILQAIFITCDILRVGE